MITKYYISLGDSVNKTIMTSDDKKRVKNMFRLVFERFIANGAKIEEFKAGRFVAILDNMKKVCMVGEYKFESEDPYSNAIIL